MLHPAPTSEIPKHMCRGTFAEHHPATATKPETVVLTFPNTDYRLELIPTEPMDLDEFPVGKRIEGTIQAQARRIDVCNTGGRYVEPVYGRPRRVQGSIISVDAGAGTITVGAGVPINCTLTAPGQKPADFKKADFVTFATLPGATFTPRKV
ncbi:MAG: hypothetical protein AAGB51_12120 [Planctomycetota bacterium]